jgi:hypothetical protein
MNQPLHLVHPITLGTPVHVGNTAFVPLLLDLLKGAEADDSAYCFLDQALEAGTTKVTEISDRGSVREILVSHHGKGFLLLLDGEQVIGAKQDRIFNASFLIAPGSEVVVPVSCVERGRWGSDDRGRDFGSSETTFVGSARGKKLRRVARNAVTHGGWDADQRTVWTDVQGYLTSSRVRSHTSAFSDAYQANIRRTLGAVSYLEPCERQVGLAVVRDNRLVGLDIVAAPSLYLRIWKKVANGALAEVDPSCNVVQHPAEVVRRVCMAWKQAQLREQVAPGCGTTLHGIGETVAFGALRHEGKILHLVASEAC